MTDPSLQKMQTTPESNVQKMHIPVEWVEAAFAAYDDAAVPDCGTSHHGIQAALTAVIPLIREDERERMAKGDPSMQRAISTLEVGAAYDDGPLGDALFKAADWLRAQGRE